MGTKLSIVIVFFLSESTDIKLSFKVSYLKEIVWSGQWRCMPEAESRSLEFKASSRTEGGTQRKHI